MLLFLISHFYCRGTSDDEMCNFYIMYYMDSKHAIPYMNCMKQGSAKLFQHIPPEANIPIPVSPENMNAMMHMAHSTGKLYIFAAIVIQYVTIRSNVITVYLESIDRASLFPHFKLEKDGSFCSSPQNQSLFVRVARQDRVIILKIVYGSPAGVCDP